MRPINNLLDMFVFYRIVTDVIHVALPILFVAQRMLPISALPDTTLTLQDFAGGAKIAIWQTTRERCLDAPPAVGVIGITIGQRLDAMQVIRQDNHCVYFKWVFCFDLAKNVAQGIDLLHQQALTAINQRHREKITASLDEIAPIFGHYLMCLFGFRQVKPDRAQPEKNPEYPP